MLKNILNVNIIAIAVVISSYLFSNAFQNRNKSNDTISVTGSGEEGFRIEFDCLERLIF